MRKAVRAVVVKNDALLLMRRNKFGEEYYTLIGGGIGVGETPEQALMREVHEESSLSVANPRLVYVEKAGDPYGDQFIFLCDYSSGDVALPAESTEAKIHALGANLYEPVWLPIKKLAEVSFVSEALRNTLVTALTQGFPSQPQTI